MESSTAVKLVWYVTYKNKIIGPSPTGAKNTPTNYTTRSITCIPTNHPPPTDQGTATAVQQQWSSTYRPIHNGSTAVRQSAPQRYTCGTPGAGWVLHFLTILHLPGESASRHPPSTHHPPPTHRPTHHHSSTTTVEQYVPTNPQRRHSSTAVRTTVGHLWYARSWVGFIYTFLLFSTFRGRARAVTHQAPTTHHPPTDQPTTTAVQQQWSSTYRPIHNGGTQQYRNTHHSGTPVAHQELGGIPFSYDSPPSAGEREPSPTKHPPPTTHPPTNPPPQRYNSSGAVRTDQSTTAAQYIPQRYTCGTPGAGWDLHFLTIFHLPGESASRLRERIFMPPARGVRVRRPLCCREQRGLMCEAGVARACGR